MRRRLGKFLPIVLIAVLVQIFAPIGASWATSIALSDPLRASSICTGFSASTSGQTDRSGQHDQHDGCCVLCCMAQAGGTPLDSPLAAFTRPYRAPQRIVWFDIAPDLLTLQTGSHAQARAPPSFS